MINRPWRAFALSVVSTFVIAGSASAVDVQNYVIAKGQEYKQTNSGTPVSIISQKPFRFYSAAVPTDYGTLSNATVKLPNGKLTVLTNAGDVFEFDKGFTNKLQLDASYPTGKYNFTFQTESDGLRSSFLTFGADVYPSVPRISNWSDLQAIDADLDTTIKWGAFAGGTTNDFVVLRIEVNGDEIFSTPFLFSEGVLNGKIASYTLPANTLSPGTSYTARLLFVKRASLNATSYPGSIGLAGFYRETEFPLVTLPEASGNGRIQFSSSAYTITETNGIADVQITRSGSGEGEVGGTFNVTNLTAASSEFTAGDFFLLFQPGPSTYQTGVSVYDDYVRDGNKTVKLSLRSDNFEIGPRSNAVLTIVDNEIAGAGTLGFSAAGYSVQETNRTANLSVVRTGGSTGAVTALYSVQSGSANGDSGVGPIDFVLTNGVVSFAAGQTNKTIAIRLQDDTLDETNEHFFASLVPLTGGAALGRGLAKVTILDNDTAGTIAFSSATFAANENAGTALVTVVRTNGRAGDLTVDYYTGTGTATPDEDFGSTSGTITFGANELSKTFSVNILQDEAADGNETFTLHLSNPTGGAKLGTISNAVFTIKDDESSVSLAAAEFARSETNASIAFVVNRSGALNTTVTVDFATANGSASAPGDFTATNGTLTFGPNVPSKTILVPVVRDYTPEENETFSLQLSNPQGGVQLGSTTMSTVTLVNDDFPGVISFSATNYSGLEGTNLTVTVKRTGLASGVTVQLSMEGLTATAGTDFTAISTNLTFNGGESQKTVRIPLKTDVTPEGDEKILLFLSSPTGGAELGATSTAIVTIKNKADPNAVPAAGDSFMNVTITGIEGNSVSKSLNIINDPVHQQTISGGYAPSTGRIQGLTGSHTIVTINGFSVVSTFHVLQFPFLIAPGPGIYNIDSSSSAGGAIWTYTVSGGGTSYAYGTGRAGSSGYVILDVVDPAKKVIAGRFNFVAVQDGGSKKVRIQGKFRLKNVTIF